MAGEYQKHHDEFQLLVSILPSCQAMLLIRGISVTSNCTKQLLKAYIEPCYIGYLQEKYNWSDIVVQIIAWKFLTLLLQHINRDVVLTKICNNQLPTDIKLVKENQHSDKKCTLCSNSETSTHLIQCKSELKLSWCRHYDKITKKDWTN